MAAQKVKLLVKFEGSYGNFVDAMSALTYFATRLTNLIITFYSPQEEYLKAAKGYWCIKNVVSAYNTADYDMHINLECDMASAVRYELAYRGSIKRNLDTQINQQAQLNKVDPELITKPRSYQFYAQKSNLYNRQHAYLINIIYELLTPCDIPYEMPIDIPTAPGAKDAVNKLLHKNREQLKPSTPYILITHGELLQERGLTVPYPENWGVLSLDLAGVDAQVVSGLVCNPRCQVVVAKAGELGRVAHAAGTPCIIEIGEDKNLLSWDSTRSERAIILDINETYNDNSLFMAAITAHLRVCFGYSAIN